MIYVQAGLYAEGKSDYEFLLPLLDRLLDDLLAQHYPGRSTVLPPPMSVDAPDVVGQGRDARIGAAIERFSDICQLFVIHADADGDAEGARKHRVEPGVRRGLAGLKVAVSTAACIPVEMIEAWMLVDVLAWQQLGCDRPVLPRDPEAVSAPKEHVEAALKSGRRGRAPQVYAVMGANVRLAALRRLAGFRSFEDELLLALRSVVDAAERA